MALYEYSNACDAYIKIEDEEEISTSEDACDAYIKNEDEEEISTSEDACDAYIKNEDEEKISASEVRIKEDPELNVPYDTGDWHLEGCEESSPVLDKAGRSVVTKKEDGMRLNLPGNSTIHYKRCTTTKSGEKRFHCMECGKSFKHFDHLKRHFVSHTGEKPFQCSDCGKNFMHAETLKTHKRLHTGERPYRCSECGRNFTQSSHLKRHLKTHAKKTVFKCLDCGECFRQLDDLKIHIKTHLPASKPEVEKIHSINYAGGPLLCFVPVVCSPPVFLLRG